MPAYIHQISTCVPENYFPQEFARDFMKAYVADRPAQKRVIHSIYARSAIEKRHSVLSELYKDGGSGIFFDRDSEPHSGFMNPGTGARNARYTSEAKKLYTDVARKTVEESSYQASDITHVITVSCTGFFAPGPDYFIVRALGLPPETRRYHIGFMGCYAAFPALKMAETITAENPDAVILIATVELCTLHLQHKTDTDSLISASVFADGAAGVLVSGRPPEADQTAFQIRGLHTALTPQGEQDMAWTIGDNGFDMVLSTYIPDIIEANLSDLLKPFFASHIDADAFGFWAVHPGGRAIVDKIQHSLGLSDEAVAPSRQILREYGNMSSATFLFVMNHILRKVRSGEAGKLVEKPLIGMAFGPGLTVETGFFDLAGHIPEQTRTESGELKGNEDKNAAFPA